MITCCKGCKERYSGCHDYCELYLKQKKKHNDEKKYLQRQQKQNRDIFLTYVEKNTRLKK